MSRSCLDPPPPRSDPQDHDELLSCHSGLSLSRDLRKSFRLGIASTCLGCDRGPGSFLVFSVDGIEESLGLQMLDSDVMPEVFEIIPTHIPTHISALTRSAWGYTSG